jgi:molecular chaperone DnaK
MLRIDGIPPAPRGVPRIEVTFRLNQDRILEATAKDLSTGNEVSITIVATDNRLTDEEKARMTREARLRVQGMLEQRMKETVLNQAESLIYRAERMIQNYDDPLADEARTLISDLRSAMEAEEHSKINNKVNELTDIMHRLESADY